MDDGTGRAARHHFRLEPDMRYLNHGSYGATPVEVLDEQARWRARMEAQPVRFFSRELPAALRAAAGRLADFVGAPAERVVFVENATAGVNAVVRALHLEPGDELLTTDHVYQAVRLTLRHVAGERGATVVEAPVGLPLPGPEAVLESLESHLGPRTRLVVIDHVASPSGVIFPAAEVARRCRARGVPLLVDGAHAPGMVELDLRAIGADYYVGNCHKWLCAPRGAGFLHVAEGREAELHPLVISHGYGQGLTNEFDWVGTRDPSAWLSVPAALAFHEARGGAALRRRNHALVIEAARATAEALGTALGAPAACFGSMATVRLPPGPPPTLSAAARLHDHLWDRARIEIPVIPFAGALWLRLSAQLYNELDDYAPLAEEARRALTAS